jgi:hypothetical protein
MKDRCAPWSSLARDRLGSRRGRRHAEIAHPAARGELLRAPLRRPSHHLTGRREPRLPFGLVPRRLASRSGLQVSPELVDLQAELGPDPRRACDPQADRPKRRTVALRASVGSTEATSGQSASVSSDRRARDRSQAKPDEVVQTPVVRLSGRAARRATNASAVRAAEVLLTHRVIWKFAD